MLPIQQLQELIQAKRLPLSVRASATSAALSSLSSWARRSRSADQEKSLDDFGDYADTLRRLKVNLSLGEHYTDASPGRTSSCAHRAMSTTSPHCRPR